MAVVGERITVTTSPTVVFDPAGRGSLTDPVPARLTNRDAAVSMFLGGSGVTTTTGYELKANESVDVAFWGSDKLYAVVTAATARMDVLKARQ